MKQIEYIHETIHIPRYQHSYITHQCLLDPSTICIPSTIVSKRKTCEEENKSEKKLAARVEDDILSYILEALQLRIISSLNAKEVVQASILSKTWISFWTRIPFLEINYFSFKNLHVFNTFVNNM